MKRSMLPHFARAATASAAAAYCRVRSSVRIPAPPLSVSHTCWSIGGGVMTIIWHAGQCERRSASMASRFDANSSSGTCCRDSGTAASLAPKKTVARAGGVGVCWMRCGSCSSAQRVLYPLKPRFSMSPVRVSVYSSCSRATQPPVSTRLPSWVMLSPYRKKTGRADRHEPTWLWRGGRGIFQRNAFGGRKRKTKPP